MMEIRERASNYGLLVAVLLIIIMVLISYIAYDKGLEKNEEKDSSSTTIVTTTEIKEEKINKSFVFKDLCSEERKCNKRLLETNNLTIKLESIEENGSVMYNLIFTGEIDKTISLNNFISLDIINSAFYLIEESTNQEEINKITLYNNKLIKIDNIEINNLLDKSLKDIELTYYTYDKTCENENKKYFIENVVMITEEGFNIISHSQGPLKDKGFAC